MTTTILKPKEMIKYIKEVVFNENKSISSEGWVNRDKRISKIAITLTDFFKKLKSYGENNDIEPYIEKTRYDETEIYVLKIKNELCKVSKMIDDDFIFVQKVDNAEEHLKLESHIIEYQDFLITQ